MGLVPSYETPDEAKFTAEMTPSSVKPISQTLKFPPTFTATISITQTRESSYIRVSEIAGATSGRNTYHHNLHKTSLHART